MAKSYHLSFFYHFNFNHITQFRFILLALYTFLHVIFLKISKRKKKLQKNIKKNKKKYEIEIYHKNSIYIYILFKAQKKNTET